MQPEAASLVAGTPAALIASVYQDLFGHAPDAAGAAYWAGQIGTGAVSIGHAILAIADGAQAADAAVLGFKVGAASYFTAAAYYGAPIFDAGQMTSFEHTIVAQVTNLATEATYEWDTLNGFSGGTPLHPVTSTYILPPFPDNTLLLS